jgi:hypothetical protein
MAVDSSSSPISNTNTQLTSISNAFDVVLNIPISTKLTRNNFLAWQCQIISLLHGYDLYKFIDPTFSPPEQTIIRFGQVEVNPEFLAWRKQDQILLGWLRSSLSESLLGQTASATSAAKL